MCFDVKKENKCPRCSGTIFKVYKGDLEEPIMTICRFCRLRYEKFKNGNKATAL